MPLEDGYKTEKELARDSEEIAKAITEYFKEFNVEESRGFVLFLIDMPTGVLQYISDLKKEHTIPMIKFWIKREEQ